MSVALGGLYQFGETEARSRKLFVSPSPDPTDVLQGDGTHLLTPPPSPGILLFKGKTNLAMGKHSFVQDLSRVGPATPQALCVCISRPKWLLPSASGGAAQHWVSPGWGGWSCAIPPQSGCRVRMGAWGTPQKSSWGACPVADGGRRVGGLSNHPTPSATPPPRTAKPFLQGSSRAGIKESKP